MTDVFATERDGITDAAWLELVARASADGSRFFTENQLYLEYARGRVQVTRYIARRGKLGLLAILFGLGIWVYALHADWGITLVCGIAVTLSGVGMVGTGVVTRRDPAPRELVHGWLAKWLAHAPLPQLLREPSLADRGAEFVPTDARHVIIVEREELVDLLLTNRAHELLSAVIVAESGYPRALRDEAARLLGADGTRSVIALHDATQNGVGLASRLAASSVFALKSRPIQDIGLFPADVQQLAELVSAIPPAYTTQVPLDSLTLPTLLTGLRGVTSGALSLAVALSLAEEAPELPPETAPIASNAAAT